MKTQNKIYVILIIFILALLLLVFLTYITFKDIKKAASQILSDKDRAIFIDTQSKDFSYFQKNYETYKPNLEKISQSFIDPENPVNFIKFLEAISSDSGVFSEINLVHSSESKNIDGLNATAFQIQTKGEFKETTTFIKKLGTAPYLILIESLTMKKSDRNDSPNLLESNFLIKVVAK